MIRQAHTYLVGAMGGATLIAIAIAFFVLLVSAQVFRDWPIAALGGDDDTAAVTTDDPVRAGTAGAVEGSTEAVASARRDGATKPPRSGAGAVTGQDGRTVVSSDNIGASGTAPSVAGGGGPAPSAGSGGGSRPASDQQPPSASGAGGGASSGSGGGGAGPSGGGGGSTAGSATSPVGQVTGAVNDTVDQVDEGALGGTLESTGVSGVTEGAVDGIAGPESAVGKVVDESVGAVGGLLDGKR